jgi:hypothetical protein
MENAWSLHEQELFNITRCFGLVQLFKVAVREGSDWVELSYILYV